MTRDPRPTYRSPSGDPDETYEDRRGPRQAIGAWTLGSLGEVSAAIELGAGLELRADRRRVALRLGAGLSIECAALPPIRIPGVTVGLGPMEVAIEGGDLGPAVEVAAGGLLAAAARVRLGVTPSAAETAADLYLASLPPAADERREVARAGPAALTIDPESEVRVGVDRRSIGVTSSRPIELEIFGLRIRALAASYEFAERRVRLVRGVGLLSWLVIGLAAIVATAWLRRRLRGPLGAPGYDPWADDARLVHLRDALAGLMPARRPGSPSRARLGAAELLAHVRCAGSPEGAWLVAKLPLGTGATIGVVIPEGEDLRLERDADGVRATIRGGLAAAIDAIPELAAIRLHGLALRFSDQRLTVDLQPGLGEPLRALLSHLVRERALPRIPAPIRRLLGRDAASLSFRLGEGRRLTIDVDAAARVTLLHGATRTEAASDPGVRLDLEGDASIPPLTLRRATYRRRDGAITLDTDPALGSLEEALLTHFVRHRIAGRAPAALGLVGPEASPPIDPARHLTAPEPLWAGELPGVGPVRVLVDKADTMAIGVGPRWIDLKSTRGVVLVADELRLAFALEQVAVDRHEGSVTAVARPSVGPYLERLLAGLYREWLAPRLDRGLPPPPADPRTPWVLYARAIEGGELRLALDPGDRLELLRAPAHLAASAPAGVAVSAPGVPPIRVDAIAWWPGEDRWDLSLRPAQGAIVGAIVGRLAHRHAASILERARSLALLPPIAALPPPPPPPPGVILWRREVATIGAIHLALLRGYAITATVEAGGALEVAIVHGLRVRLHTLSLRLVIHSVRASIDPWTLTYAAEPELGALERGLLDPRLLPLLERARRFLWPEGPTHPAGRVLAEVAADQPWGPLRLALPRATQVVVSLDAERLAIHAPQGLHVVLGGVSWLPDLELRHLAYRLADGAVELDFGGIVERFYHEAESVSPITEAIVAHLVRVLVSPRLPALLGPLGFRRFELPAPPVAAPGEIDLAEVPVGDLGVATLSMPADAAIVASASDDEVMIECAAGLVLRIPGLRLAVSLRGARYHPRSGEVQVGGLGQLENAIIESILRANFGASVKTTPIADFLATLPRTKDGRRVLFSSAAVEVMMRPGARFTLAFSAGGIDFSADPPLDVDGPAALDYQLDGLRYTFSRARFSVQIADDGALASLFTGVVSDAVGKQLSDLLHPLLPPAMRAPGYDLAADPRSAEHIAAVIGNFMGRARPRE